MDISLYENYLTRGTNSKFLLLNKLSIMDGEDILKHIEKQV